ncbi:PEP-dependent dihydroxyacetone kinase, ADP-binding subunit DhaL [Rubrobacter xylanophilus DSM 9941]|uniref:dihydroxyacetone kinase subunit DhaL n=1 Tax=Rubrobacter xylanophilus TaxID=49319 RepID=UPI001C63E66E|nr:dihydroxyacetone kinase subunit DhaL [Rubrobacter xylanophilus]QYJ14307.1 PEP-dependent dihydroxyacetone kinase, ADP-binding subunit DhaL [Rubrobacter xylanophilus DSM 9941]
MDATEKTLGVVREMAAAMEEHRAELTQLDSAIGDGDHGTNMHRGFQAALERLETSEPSTPADVLKAVSMALVSRVGGAAGPLYGTAFLRASSALSGREEPSAADVAAALEAALQGVKQRGRAEPGDKTMVDALEPAVRAARGAEGEGIAAMLRAAAEAAREGAEATVPLTARKGRASYLGDRSAGHKDPGAASTAYLLAAAARALEGS